MVRGDDISIIGIIMMEKKGKILHFVENGAQSTETHRRIWGGHRQRLKIQNGRKRQRGREGMRKRDERGGRERERDTQRDRETGV